MVKDVHHVVRRPGKLPGDPAVEIPVAEDLVSVPGIPLKEKDLSFYNRTYPLENPDIEKAADREWTWTVFTDEIAEYRKKHNAVQEPLLEAASKTGDLGPTGDPGPRQDVTEVIRNKARGMGFGEVGFTRFDRRYIYNNKKRYAKHEHAICLALEQNYTQTQAIPSLEGEYAHFGTYEIEGALALDLADYIRALGYHAQVHLDGDDTAVIIPMFVNAGLGQLGANGQLLSPHFGSRARLAVISTDAPISYDSPVDYGIHKFCQICQVCINRCPGRALIRDKVWWRGTEKNKLIYDRCRPVMARYEGCGVCMKVCPIQRYGMKPVMEYYVETGEVLGKGTHNLEGYSLRDKGYFGPGELPQFNRPFFDIPHGRAEDWLFTQFKERLAEEGVPALDEIGDFATRVKDAMDQGASHWKHR